MKNPIKEAYHQLIEESKSPKDIGEGIVYDPARWAYRKKEQTTDLKRYTAYVPFEGIGIEEIDIDAIWREDAYDVLKKVLDPKLKQFQAGSDLSKAKLEERIGWYM